MNLQKITIQELLDGKTPDWIDDFTGSLAYRIHILMVRLALEFYRFEEKIE
jgi:hypothetical protein